MAEEIRKVGYIVEASDIVFRGYGKGGIDFLTADIETGKYDIITNPPYTLFIEFLTKAMRIAKGKVAMLLPITFLSSQERFELYKQYPPARVYVYTHRICIAKNGKFDDYVAGQNLTIYAWFVWEKDYKGETILRWISTPNR